MTSQHGIQNVKTHNRTKKNDYKDEQHEPHKKGGVILSLFRWPLYCLSFFDLRLQIILLHFHFDHYIICPSLIYCFSQVLVSLIISYTLHEHLSPHLFCGVRVAHLFSRFFWVLLWVCYCPGFLVGSCCSIFSFLRNILYSIICYLSWFFGGSVFLFFLIVFSPIMCLSSVLLCLLQYPHKNVE
jgi:hypothetical protein